MAIRATGILAARHAGSRMLRHGRADRWPVGLALALGIVSLAVLLAGVAGALPPWLIAIWVAASLWWCSNTIAHSHIHTPFFIRQRHNLGFALYLTGLLGLPQSIWRARHLWHHAGEPADRPPRLLTPLLAVETGLVLGVWAAIAWLSPTLFASAWLPGWLLGLSLCALHGHLEHAGATHCADQGISCYRRLYNLVWLNDGYHAEHHHRPGRHWSRLPRQRLNGARVSDWPPVLRWLDALPLALNAGIGQGLNQLERAALHSRTLQRWLIDRHADAIRRVLAANAAAGEIQRATVVGGGLFPRTVLALRLVLPDVILQVIESDPRHIAAARRILALHAVPEDAIVFHQGDYPSSNLDLTDLAVFPLAFRGDRAALYRSPPARLTLVHDWLWRRRGQTGIVVSPLLLKRLNLVAPLPGDQR